MTFVFSTSSIGMLWVYSWLSPFHWGGLFRLKWSSLWSSIRVSRFSARIYSFPHQVAHICKLMFLTNIHVCDQCQCFFSFHFFKCCLELLWCLLTWGPSSRICNSFSMLFIHSAFCNDLTVPNFFSKIFFASLTSGCQSGLTHSPPNCW